jgi:hypothetical protein
MTWNTITDWSRKRRIRNNSKDSLSNSINSAVSDNTFVIICICNATTDKQLRESEDCPDCYNTVIKFYDWGKTKYICENCGLTIANYSILSGVRDWKINPVRLIYNSLVGTVLYGNHGVMN